MTIKRHGKGKVSSALAPGACQLLVLPCAAGTGTSTFVTLSGRQGQCVDPSRALGQLRQLPQNLGNETCWERRHAQYGVARRGRQSRVRQRWHYIKANGTACSSSTNLVFLPHLFYGFFIPFPLAELPLCILVA